MIEIFINLADFLLFFKSAVRYGTRKSSVREKVDARTVYIYSYSY